MYAKLYSNRYLEKEIRKMREDGYDELECEAFKHDLESANMMEICRAACDDEIEGMRLMREIDPKVPVVDSLELFSYHVMACVKRATGKHVVALWRNE